jgi:hypothetical protein
MNQNQLIQQELNPQITVVMPVYNGEKYLDTAILLTLAVPLSASSVILPVVMPVFTLKYRFVIV